MEIIPVLNCVNKDCFVKRIEACRSFLPKKSFIHLDISSIDFALSESFIDFNIIKKESDYFNFEGHLMLGPADISDEKWFKSSIKRLFFHSEAVGDWGSILKKSNKYKKEIGIVFDASSNKSPVVPGGVRFVQILAVPAGPSGQKFNIATLDKIKFLKKNYSNVRISVDGGINIETAILCKRAGADIVNSGSYIWDSPNPVLAYNNLLESVR